MKYEVNEKKIYDVLDISNIEEYNYELKHLETTFELEKYVLEINLVYKDLQLEEKKEIIILPIDLTTTMTEQLNAIVKNVHLNLIKGSGVEVDMTLEIEVIEFENDNKEEIHEIYQAELEAKLQERCDCTIEDVSLPKEEIIDTTMTIGTNAGADSPNFFSDLNTSYDKYRVLNLEENSLDKISAKYNLPLDYLYKLKKTNSKVIVHDKE